MKLAAVARRHLPIAIGASALVLGGALASAGSAGAADHGSQIQNYPLKQIDIGQAGVSGTRHGQDEIAHQSIGQVDIGENGVSGSAGGSAGEIKKGSVGEDDLGSRVRHELHSKHGHGHGHGLRGYEVVGAEATWQPGAGKQAATAQCPKGKVVIGGGFNSDNASTQPDKTNSAVQLLGSGPSGISQHHGTWVATSWTVRGFNSGKKKFNITPYALCAAR